jgi:membrane-bound metal-dependent hydrolase YbcI (DUF457 family)
MLAGVAAAWAVDLAPGNRVLRTAPESSGWWARAGGGVTAACAVLAAAPDLDLLSGAVHRTVTHSLTAVAVVTVVAGLAAAGRSRSAVRIALMCGAAYATHLLLDLTAVDQLPPKGIQLLWPFSHDWFITNWMIFRPTERRHVLSVLAIVRNAKAGAQEIAVMAPILLALWWARLRTLRQLQ